MHPLLVVFEKGKEISFFMGCKNRKDTSGSKLVFFSGGLPLLSSLYP